MIYPFNNPENRKIKGYHIVLDKLNEKPLRMYYKDIEKILELQCFTYEDAKKKEIEFLEEHLEYLKKNLK